MRLQKTDTWILHCVFPIQMIQRYWLTLHSSQNNYAELLKVKTLAEMLTNDNWVLQCCLYIVILRLMTYMTNKNTNMLHCCNFAMLLIIWKIEYLHKCSCTWLQSQNYNYLWFIKQEQLGLSQLSWQHTFNLLEAKRSQACWNKNEDKGQTFL